MRADTGSGYRSRRAEGKQTRRRMVTVADRAARSKVSTFVSVHISHSSRASKYALSPGAGRRGTTRRRAVVSRGRASATEESNSCSRTSVVRCYALGDFNIKVNERNSDIGFHLHREFLRSFALASRVIENR